MLTFQYTPSTFLNYTTYIPIIGSQDNSGLEQVTKAAINPRKLSSSSTKTTELKIPADGTYFISEYASIAKIMESLIAEVAALLDVDIDVAQILLQYTKWDKEKLIDQYFASSEKLMIDAGLDLYTPVILSEASQVTGKVPGVGSTQSTTLIPPPPSGSSKMNVVEEPAFTCRICYDECPITASFGLGCGHLFCRPCYTGYLTAQISDGPVCILAHCAQHKCKQAITRGVYTSLLSPLQQVEGTGGVSGEPQALDKYSLYVVRNFIEMTKGTSCVYISYYILS